MSDEKRSTMRALAAERRPPRIVALTPQMVAENANIILRDGARWLLPADHLLVREAARNLAVADQVWSYLEQRGSIDNRGRPRGSMRQWLALQNTIGRQLSALGFSPLARAELGKNLAASKLDVAQAMRYGRSRSERIESGQGEQGESTTGELGPGAER